MAKETRQSIAIRPYEVERRAGAWCRRLRSTTRDGWADRRAVWVRGFRDPLHSSAAGRWCTLAWMRIDRYLPALLAFAVLPLSLPAGAQAAAQRQRDLRALQALGVVVTLGYRP